jgi:hypothetical protein
MRIDRCKSRGPAIDTRLLAPPDGVSVDAKPLASRNGQLTQRVTAVDERPGAGPRCGTDTPQRLLARLRMTTVERTDPDSEYEVERLFVGRQHEVFGGDLAQAHAPRGDFCGCGGSGLCDGLCRAVDGQDMPGDEPGHDGSSRRTRPASDLEDTQLRLERKRIHDRGETR